MIKVKFRQSLKKYAAVTSTNWPNGNINSNINEQYFFCERPIVSIT
jgi:hypothetical protein